MLTNKIFNASALSRNVDCIKNKRVKCERKNRFRGDCPWIDNLF